jgi:hypothetical protein
MPEPGDTGLTVAVKVTGPLPLGFCEDVRVVMVEA